MKIGTYRRRGIRVGVAARWQRRTAGGRLTPATNRFVVFDVDVVNAERDDVESLENYKCGQSVDDDLIAFDQVLRIRAGTSCPSQGRKVQPLSAGCDRAVMMSV